MEAIQRGLDVLALFRADRPTLTLAEITRLVSGVPSTTLRIVNTLEDMGFLESMPDRAAYRAGPSSLRIGHSCIVGSRLRAIASPSLARLRDACGEGVSLGVVSDESVYLIDQLQAVQPMSLTLPVGARLPVRDTAAGKAILAFSPAAAIDLALGSVAGNASDTRATRSKFVAELATVRRTGYAIQDQVFAGTRSIAAAVLGEDGAAIAAIMVAVGAGRYELSDLARVLSPLVVGAAAEVGARWRAERAAVVRDRREEPEYDASSEPDAAKETEQRSRYHVEALSRGLQTLLAFTPGAPRLPLTEIAQRTAFLMPTSFRIVSTLTSLGYIRRDDATGKHELTPKVLELGYDGLAWLSVSEFVLPRLMRFEAETQVSVYLSVLAGDAAVDIVSLGRPGVMTTIGRSYPLYCTPGGKVLLAFMPQAQARAIVETVELVKRAPKTLVDYEALSSELEAIRSRGYSVSDQEYLPGSVGVGVPLLNAAGECVATIACVVRGNAADRTVLDRLVVQACEMSEDLNSRMAARFT